MTSRAPSGTFEPNTSSNSTAVRRSTGPFRLSGGLIPVALVLAASNAGAQDPVPAEPTIVEVEQSLAAKRFDVRTLERHYETRIRTVDRAGPKINSVIELNPDAAKLAAALDAGSSHGQPLFGIPVLLKDNIDTGDGMQTTAGSLALVGSKPPRDAFIVRKLRQAGALLLGKTNLSEWANFRSTHSSSGWSGRGGQTLNPYALNRNPCGSSSGSGAAIAADLAVVAVGTETDGSVVCPSSVNGLVGIKPTVGLVSRTGIIPISASQDTAGPMARSVADAAALLTVLAGYDPDDPATEPLKSRPALNYTQFLNRDGLKGVRIGVVRQLAGFHDEVDILFNRAIDALRAQGAIIVDPASIPTQGKFDADEQTVLLYEFKDGVNRYLANRGATPRNLADLIAFNNNEHDREMPHFGQDQFISAQGKGPLSDQEYIEAHARAKRSAGADGIDAALAKDHLDVLIAPTTGAAWTTDWVNGDHFVGGNTSSAPAVAGYPHITVPMGQVQGLPVGLSFVGTAWSEPKLITYAYAYEQITHARQGPHFSTSIP
jgi:amidase